MTSLLASGLYIDFDYICQEYTYSNHLLFIVSITRLTKLRCPSPQGPRIDNPISESFKVIGFKIEYQRKESNFVFLSFQGAQLMLDQTKDDKKSPWFTGIIRYPRGRGIHLQIAVKDVATIHGLLKKHNYPIKQPPKEYWFRKDGYLIGMKGLVVMDPDGYILMFNEDIGVKKIR
jgi:lactoylglutathione lyase